MQENIDRDLRMLVGDLSVQIIFAKAQVAELERQLAEAQAQIEPRAKPNGKGKDEQQGTAPN